MEKQIPKNIDYYTSILLDYTDISTDCIIIIVSYLFPNFNFKNFKIIYTINKFSELLVSFVTSSNDNIYIALATSKRDVKIYNVLNNSLICSLCGHSKSISALHCYSELSQGVYLFTGSFDRSIRIFFINSKLLDSIKTENFKSESYNSSVVLFGHQSTIFSLMTIPDNKLASASADYYIYIWDISNILNNFNDVISYQRGADFDSNNIIIARLSTNKSWPTNLSFGNNKLFCLCSSSNLVYEINTQNFEISEPYCDKRNDDLAFYPIKIDSKNSNIQITASCKIMSLDLIAIGTSSGDILLFSDYDLKFQTSLEHSNSQDKHSTYISCLISYDNFLISGSHDCTIKVWDLALINKLGFVCIRTIDDHNSQINTLKLLDNGWLVSGSYGKVKIYGPS